VRRASIIRGLQDLAAFYLRHSPINYKKAGVFSKILYPLLLQRPIHATVSTLYDFRMSVDTDDVIDRYIYAFGVWEPSLTTFVMRRLRPGDIFIDLGANTGYYTVLAAKQVGSTGRVIAVEASPKIYDQLLRNVKLNGLDNVRAIACAVSDSTGTIELFAGPAGNRGETTVVAQRGFRSQAVVQKERFDTLIELEEFRRARLIKMDVEGHEPEALSGIYHWLASGRDDLEIVVELTGQTELAARGVRQSEILDTFARNGYCAYRVDNRYSSWTYARAEHSVMAYRLRGPLDELADVVFSKADQESLTL
jgi:FkbM family methyltransferase